MVLMGVYRLSFGEGGGGEVRHIIQSAKAYCDRLGVAAYSSASCANFLFHFRIL